jgi:hypothetical protein
MDNTEFWDDGEPISLPKRSSSSRGSFSSGMHALHERESAAARPQVHSVANETSPRTSLAARHNNIAGTFSRIQPATSVHKFTYTTHPESKRVLRPGRKLQSVLTICATQSALSQSPRRTTLSKLSQLLDVLSLATMVEYGIDSISSERLFRMSAYEQTAYVNGVCLLITNALKMLVVQNMQTYLVGMCSDISQEVREWAKSATAVTGLLTGVMDFHIDGTGHMPDACISINRLYGMREQLGKRKRNSEDI